MWASATVISRPSIASSSSTTLTIRNRSTEPVSALNFASISRFMPNVRLAAVRIACSSALMSTRLVDVLVPADLLEDHVQFGFHRSFLLRRYVASRLGFWLGAMARLDRLAALARPTPLLPLHHRVPVGDELGVLDVVDRQLETSGRRTSIDDVGRRSTPREHAAEVAALAGCGSVQRDGELDLGLAAGEVREVRGGAQRAIDAGRADLEAVRLRDRILDVEHGRQLARHVLAVVEVDAVLGNLVAIGASLASSGRSMQTRSIQPPCSSRKRRSTSS